MLSCPLYSVEREHRNVIDMAKAVFIRPGSTKHPDTPAHSFDLVTIEREFTLCAETQDNARKWLQMLTRAVDEDVAILPDEDLLFKVKAKVDPLAIFNPMDYSTQILVSANCVNVTSTQSIGSSNANLALTSSEVQERGGKGKCTWVYTDFYKWSLISERNKLALMVSVFSDETFKRRLEFHFRTKEAQRLATAIEFFIEKFMSVMHIMLETGDEIPEVDKKDEKQKENDAPPLPQPHSSLDTNLIDLLSDNTTQSNDTSSFSDDFFFSSPVGGENTGLTEAQIAQHHLWLKNARINNGGPLYDDGTLQIAAKVEVRGSQGRITLFYRNKNTVSSIESFSVNLTNVEGYLRSQLGPLSTTTIASGSQVEHQILVECMKPMDINPNLQISYKKSDGTVTKNDLILPLHLTVFNDPLSIDRENFEKRWQMLSGAGQESSATVIRRMSLSQEEANQLFEHVLKFARVQGTASNIIWGAASLRTGATAPNSSDKITMGCLIKIESSGPTINIICRTVHPAATSALTSIVKHILSD
jgi:hypothetical protein